MTGERARRPIEATMMRPGVTSMALVALLLLPAALAASAAAAAAAAAAPRTAVSAAAPPNPAAAAAAAAAAPDAAAPRPAPEGSKPPSTSRLPSPTHAGYLDLANGRGSMYYMYYEAEQPDDPSLKTTPVLLWLQGGPGCSSLFGAFYINGPYLINADLSLRPNPGRWNRKYGTLFVDQPLGVGFSVARDPRRDVPAHELPLAADLYVALNAFYGARGPAFAARPLFVTGESYAGKYVPSIAHYILQAHARAHGYERELRHPRRLAPGEASAPPLFPYGGCAIGNGFTDAVEQTLVQAEVAHGMGLIDWRQRREVEALQAAVVEAVRDRRYRRARELSDQVLGAINEASGLGTLEDVRREKGYDAEDRVSRLLNLPDVRRAVGVRDDDDDDGEAEKGADASSAAAPPSSSSSPTPPPKQSAAPLKYESCSPVVDRIMGADVMRSTAKLVPDLLAHGHVMLYHGQFDAECGARSNEAWLETLPWPGHSGFRAANRTRWWGGVKEERAREAAEKKNECGGRGEAAAPSPAAAPEEQQEEQLLPNAHSGFLKSHMRLTHYIVRNAGHMVPHDRPEVGRALIEEWVDGVLSGKWEDGGEGAAGGGLLRVMPGRRPPPLAGPWAAWGGRVSESGGVIYESYDEERDDAEVEGWRQEEEEEQQQREQQEGGRAGAGASAAAATF